MARIFISYSRADRAFVEELVPLLQPVFPEYGIFYDEHISGGEDWWQRILAEITACDLFIYLLSNDSIGSGYCQAEFREALRLRKACLPVIVRPKTEIANAPSDLAAEIRRREWIDLADGFKHPKENAKLYAAIRRLMKERPAAPPPPVSPEPVSQPDITLVSRKERHGLTANQVALIVAVIGLVGTVAAAIITGLFGLLDTNGGAPTPTTAAILPTTAAPGSVETPTETLTPTIPTATDLPTQTLTPTEIDIAQVVGTLDAQATDAQATLYVQETAAARATAYAAGTQSILDQTATATWWTDTPTPDITASIDAFRTQQATTATAQAITALTATADAWTDTPTPTLTPSDTPTSTSTPTSTPTDTPTATPTLTPLEAALQRAASFTGSNTDWEPFATTFPDDPAGAEMVLVPVGRFMMGSEDGDDDELPVHAQVIAAPFWIDRTEVTRGQYAVCVAAGACTETPDNGYSQRDTQPINRVTWFQARDYCAWRGMRLPTEAGWEYAARGPSGWAYPWGDEWDANNAVYSGNSSNLTADVGSRPAGASWVGALDLSGNVWEWVSSLSMDYPYNSSHESSTDTNSARVLRGGSFYVSSVDLRAANRSRAQSRQRGLRYRFSLRPPLILCSVVLYSVF